MDPTVFTWNGYNSFASYKSKSIIPLSQKLDLEVTAFN